MKERQIRMSGPMVCALLRDVNPETHTRRLIKLQFPPWGADGEQQRTRRYPLFEYNTLFLLVRPA